MNFESSAFVKSNSAMLKFQAHLNEAMPYSRSLAHVSDFLDETIEYLVQPRRIP